MKANEIRLGNYYNQFGNIHQVNGHIISELEKAPQGQLWCKAIPLTEEWLLKFGFIKHENHSIWYTLNKVDVWFFDGKYVNDNDVEINFVHELQNLYFALTKKELTMK
jgi:hypothetical protein